MTNPDKGDIFDEYFGDDEEQLAGYNCPNCGYPLVVEDGLTVCYRCGYAPEEDEE